MKLNHLVPARSRLLLQSVCPTLSTTRERFFANFGQYVKPIRRWYRKHETENPYKVAAQVYVSVLSQPQLYQEGNHRTGSLIASGILAERLSAIRSLPPECRLACIAPGELMNVVSARDTMADYSHILFNKDPAQLHLLGARGGRA